MSADSKSVWNARYATRKMVSPLDFAKQSLQYLKNGQSLLDIGCGDGRDADFFARNGLLVTAIDFSDEAIERVKKLNPNIDTRMMDILSMDFPDETFDAVYAHLSVQYFDDTSTTAIFSNIHRMLKAGGYFFVKCKSIRDPLYGQGKKVGKDMFANPYVRHFFSKEYMSDTLQNFTILELEETTATYDGKDSAFIEAIARKKLQSR